MRKLVLAALAGLGLAAVAAPSTASAAVFSLAPAMQAAGDHSLQQATPIEEARTRRRRRRVARR
ncbi:MAG TPA: hypothetical protein VD970_15620 [Acetobacteraceae bacterium]|nr:hypothetical protein [Acetobacteraceae bacterium]